MPETPRPSRLRLVSAEDEDMSNIVLTEEEVQAQITALRQKQQPRRPPPNPAKRRQFARYDETWRAPVLAAGKSVRAATHRLIAVLIAKADFDKRILIGKEIEAEAGLSPYEKRQALQHSEKLGLIAIERRGSGRAPIVTPLCLGGRPGRR